MKLSQAGFKNIKLNKTEEAFKAQNILLDSGQLYQYASGVFGLNLVPYGAKQRIDNIIRKVFNKYGLIEISLPTLQPKNIWEETDRYNKYIEDGTMLVTDTNHGTFCLAPTAEEAVTTFIKQNVSSYKSLPLTYYQIGEKYRNEIRNRGYLFRGKVFSMLDAYSFDTNKENLNKTYKVIRKAFLEIFEELGLPVIPIAADSGAIGGSKSEEFMLISPLGEDTILHDDATNTGLNTEILEKENYEEYLKEEYGINSLDNFKEVKAIELGHIFELGTIYSEKMNAKFTTADEKEEVFYMGCYGIGITRVLATIYEYFALKENDEVTGINLPLSVAPFLANIVYNPINETKVNQAENLYKKLLDRNIPVILDDRDDTKLSLGQRINATNILGTPFVAILGDKREDNKIELEFMKTGQQFVLDEAELIDILESLEKNRNFDWGYAAAKYSID